MSPAAFLRLEWLLSLALTLLAVAWATAQELPLAAALAPTTRDLVLGMAAGAALWSTIPLLLRSAAMRRIWTELLLPFSRGLATRDIVVIALLSGFTEELFFRGVLLPETGLVLSSLCFGALHALCLIYFVWATVIGVGLGTLALTCGSLVAPITAHATYNLGALLLLRRSARRGPPSPLGTSVDAVRRGHSTIASTPGFG